MGVTEQPPLVGGLHWWADMIRLTWNNALWKAKQETFDGAVVAARQIQQLRNQETWSFLPEDWRLLRVTEAPTFYGQYAEVGDLVLARKKRPERCDLDHTMIFSLRFGSEVAYPNHYLVAL